MQAGGRRGANTLRALHGGDKLSAAVTRQNDALKLIELAGLTALVGAFFFMLNHANMLPAVVVIAVLLLYDWIICRVFLNIEVKRLCAKSARWHKSDARRHVRKRAETGLFH